MRLHFAGSDATDAYNEILHDVGGTCRLESYYSLNLKKPPSAGFIHLLDSGGFVARMKGVPIDVKQYARYINTNKVELCFNLDTADVEETLQNQKYLDEHTWEGCTVIPVYHLSDWKDPEHRSLLEMFVENYDYISVGGVAGEGSARKYQHQLYKHVFNVTQDKVKVHGLGITSKSVLELYPWFSVDSTSWLSSARFGNSRLHSNKMVAEFYAKNKHYLHNTKMEAAYWVKLEKYITKLWKLRGIQWT